MPPADEEVKEAIIKIQGYDVRMVDGNEKVALERLLQSTLLDDVVKPIGSNSTDSGYYRALKGLLDQDLAEVEAGCKEEITKKGKHLTECVVIDGYISCLYTATEPGVFALKFAKVPRGIPRKLALNVALCMSNNLMFLFTQSALYGSDSNIGLDFYKMVQDSCKDFDKENIIEKHKLYVIKSGILQGLTMTNAYKRLESTALQILADLAQCCELMPNFYHAHMQRFYVEQGNVHPIAEREQLKELCDRFPHGVELRNTYVVQLGLQFDEMDEAQRELKELRALNSDRVDETWWAEGMLYKNKPQSVEFFKRAFENRPYDGLFCIKLGQYFELVTHEYGKALEAYNRGMETSMVQERFNELLKLRHNLLGKILAENYWEKL